MALHHSTFEVEEKTLDTLLVAGVRMKGRYDECGKGFAKIGQETMPTACGTPYASPGFVTSGQPWVATENLAYFSATSANRFPASESP